MFPFFILCQFQIVSDSVPRAAALLDRLLTGRKPTKEIVRVRMEKVKDLLTTTSMKVVEVAAATGFARPSHLFRTFRKQLGPSPKAYRKRKTAKTGPPASPRARR